MSDFTEKKSEPAPMPAKEKPGLCAIISRRLERYFIKTFTLPAKEETRLEKAERKYRRFITKLYIYTLILIAGYAAVRLIPFEKIREDYAGTYPINPPVKVDDAGIIAVTDQNALIWLHGKTVYEEARKEIEKNNQSIRTLREGIDKELISLASNLPALSSEKLAAVSEAVARGWSESRERDPKIERRIVENLEGMENHLLWLEEHRKEVESKGIETRVALAGIAAELTFVRSQTESTARAARDADNQSKPLTVIHRLALPPYSVESVPDFGVQENDKALTVIASDLGTDLIAYAKGPDAANAMGQPKIPLIESVSRLTNAIQALHAEIAAVGGAPRKDDWRLATYKKMGEDLHDILKQAREVCCTADDKKSPGDIIKTLRGKNKAVADLIGQIETHRQQWYFYRQCGVSVPPAPVDSALSELRPRDWSPCTKPLANGAKTPVDHIVDAIKKQLNSPEAKPEIPGACEASKKTPALTPDSSDHAKNASAELAQDLKTYLKVTGSDPLQALRLLEDSLPEDIRVNTRADAFQSIADKMAEWKTLWGLQKTNREVLISEGSESFFYKGQVGSIFDMLALAAIGVLCKMLYDANGNLVKKFFPDDAVEFTRTKIVYGPMTSLILCLCGISGLVTFGDVEARLTILPLLAFLFGFASYRTSQVIDKIAEKILGSAEVNKNKPTTLPISTWELPSTRVRDRAELRAELSKAIALKVVQSVSKKTSR